MAAARRPDGVIVMPRTYLLHALLRTRAQARGNTYVLRQAIRRRETIIVDRRYTDCIPCR